MNTLIAEPDTKNLPTGVHHTAYVVADLARTRHFYEDLVGLPLISTYCESNDFAQNYCHCFFGLGAGAALAFFQFADPSMVAKFKRSPIDSQFYHVALRCTRPVQQAILGRLKDANYASGLLEIDHGYCHSVYLTDPDGMIVEFTVDSDEVDYFSKVYKDAHGELSRWLKGDHTPNNPMRTHG